MSVQINCAPHPELVSSANNMQHGGSLPSATTDASNATTMSSTTQRANKPRPLKLVAPTSASPLAAAQLSPGGPAKLGGATTFYLPRSQNGGGGPTPPQPLFHQPVTIDEVLELMQQINNTVKAGQFNPQLATQIFRLCQQLKISGECMEQSHKNELNRVLVSLRQACCRDSGQLGTPCRLKIMELVELRAMGWRPSMAHSQYYLNRNPPGDAAHEYHTTSDVQQPPLSNHAAHTAAHYAPPLQMAPAIQRSAAGEQAAALLAGPAPVSAPPFGAMPLNAFPFGGGGAPPSMFHPAAVAAALHHQQQQQHHQQQQQQQHRQMELAAAGGHPTQLIPTATTHASSVHQSAPSYFLIPASGAYLPQTMMMQPPPASPLGPSMPQVFPPVSLHQQQQMHLQQTQLKTAGLDSASGGGASGEQNSVWPKGAVTKPSKFPRPQKVPSKNQYRDEIVIRNADSGKIMGVKGRRVAVVEEISNTVISFQKVVPGSKERTLTITGNTEEVIEHAKRLVDETIRRNVSPNRPEGGASESAEGADTVVVIGDENTVVADELAAAIGIDGDDDNMGINIETGEDGVLRLSCADPKVLQAAQEALSEYFTRKGVGRRSHGMTAEEREERKERRKSMPSFPPDGAKKDDKTDSHLRTVSQSDSQTSKRLVVTGTNLNSEKTTGSESLNWRNVTKSTPDLSAANAEKAKPQPVGTINYSRDRMLDVSASALSTVAPEIVTQLASDMPEIVRQPAVKFSAAEYRAAFNSSDQRK